MYDEGTTEWIAVASIILVLMGVLVCTGFVSEYQCKERWKDSGQRSRFDWTVGCYVQRKDGSWVPERVIREVQQ